ncbi:MAG: WbqC family protein, partial [Duncaniella sp.]|nr:WbqC family protein [Duncaniella sp.]
LAGAGDSCIRNTLPLPAAADAEADPQTVCESGLSDSEIALPQYWQVRADKLGFIPGLSVLDLIFNLGPEAVIYLDRL